MTEAVLYFLGITETDCCREYDGGWRCVNGLTDCPHNDGQDNCSHPGTDMTPLDKETTNDDET